ncbi:hypothetical protein QS290_21420, partial [Escherichia coli]|nr:hypothetical protein [Escherichia coli]MDL9607958.1 hypothetical protein [Escherichia coli]MDL9663260.1 hypothetical protein [Escherichia coli]
MQNLMPPINTPDQLFHDGDPTQGIEGTIVTADYLNNQQGATRDLQQELLNVLGSVHIQPAPQKTDQLLTALRALLLSRKNPFGDIKSDGTVERALENLGLQDVKAGSLNNLYTNHSRSVLMELPLLFPDYDTVLAAQSGAEYMYPQGFVVTGEKIYLSYTVEPKQ